MDLSGRYELHRQVGEGGRATVWEGFDTKLERRVLIRVLRPELERDPHEVEQFLEDARSAARGVSKSGARVLDAGYGDGKALPFVVFEWPGQVPDDGSRGRVVPPKAKGGRGVQRLAVVLLLVPAVAGAVVIRGLLAGDWTIGNPVPNAGVAVVLPTPRAVTDSAPAQPTVQPTKVPQLQLQPTAIRVPTVAPTPDRSAAARGRIVNTDGIGVALRAGAGGPRLPGKGYDEGVTVTVLEEQGTWVHIRGDDGRDGWIPAVTLSKQ